MTNLFNDVLGDSCDFYCLGFLFYFIFLCSPPLSTLVSCMASAPAASPAPPVLLLSTPSVSPYFISISSKNYLVLKQVHFFLRLSLWFQTSAAALTLQWKQNALQVGWAPPEWAHSVLFSRVSLPSFFVTETSFFFSNSWFITSKILVVY